jgi:hypothetical protein
LTGSVSLNFNVVNAFDSNPSFVQSGLFVASIAAAGTPLNFSSFVGSSPFRNDTNYQAEIAVDGSGNIYLAGYTYGVTTVNALQPLPGGGANPSDAFVFKISPADGAAVSLVPGVVDFGNQPINTTSVAQNIVLRNLGTTVSDVTSVSVSGDFALNNGCGAQVPASGGSCSLSITFTPTTVGTRTGSVTIVDSAPGSPHTLSLTGTGAVPGVALQPTSLTFGVTAVGTTSATQRVTLTNSGGATLTITRIQGSGDFAETNDCTATLAGGSACSIDVTFTPTADGTRIGTLTISDSAADSPQSLNLVGGVSPDFSISATTSTASISAGGTAHYNLTVAGNALFSGTIQFTCTGAPAPCKLHGIARHRQRCGQWKR